MHATHARHQLLNARARSRVSFRARFSTAQRARHTSCTQPTNLQLAFVCESGLTRLKRVQRNPTLGGATCSPRILAPRRRPPHASRSSSQVERSRLERVVILGSPSSARPKRESRRSKRRHDVRRVVEHPRCCAPAPALHRRQGPSISIHVTDLSTCRDPLREVNV